jgi:hypothetical protein
MSVSSVGPSSRRGGVSGGSVSFPPGGGHCPLPIEGFGVIPKLPKASGLPVFPLVFGLSKTLAACAKVFNATIVSIAQSNVFNLFIIYSYFKSNLTIEIGKSLSFSK